jgi:hypothetical protein
MEKTMATYSREEFKAGFGHIGKSVEETDALVDLIPEAGLPEQEIPVLLGGALSEMELHHLTEYLRTNHGDGDGRPGITGPIQGPVKECPKDGTVNPASALYCRTCGTKLPEVRKPEGEYCTKTGQLVAPGSIYCNHCGQKLPHP